MNRSHFPIFVIVVVLWCAATLKALFEHDAKTVVILYLIAGAYAFAGPLRNKP